MVRESISVDDAIELLNEANRLDPNAVALLVADHPTIQVGTNCQDVSCPCGEQNEIVHTVHVGEPGADHPPNAGRVGLLGILNGLFGTYEDGYGPITAHVDTDTQFVTEFRRSRPAGTR